MNVCPPKFSIPNTNLTLEDWKKKSCFEKQQDVKKLFKRKIPPTCENEIRNEMVTCQRERGKMTREDALQILCLCKEIYPLAYPRLIDLSTKYLDLKTVEEARKLTKNEICNQFSLHYPQQFGATDLISSDLGTWISDHSPDEIHEMMQGKSFKDVKCVQVLPPLPPTETTGRPKPFSLENLQDPITFELLEDFVRILPDDQRLVNWPTVLGIRAGRHPWRQIQLPSDIASAIHPDEKTRQELLRGVRQDWGWAYYPPHHSAPSQEELKKKLFSQVEYSPLAFPLAERQVQFQFQNHVFEPITVFPGERLLNVYQRWRDRIREQKTEDILRAQGGFPAYDEREVYFGRMHAGRIVLIPGSTSAIHVSYPAEQIQIPGHQISLWLTLFNGSFPREKKEKLTRLRTKRLRKQSVWVMVSPPLLLFLYPRDHVGDIRRLLFESKTSLPSSYQLISFCGDKRFPEKQMKTQLSDNLQIRDLPQDKNKEICPLYIG